MKDSDGCILEIQIHSALRRCSHLDERLYNPCRDLKYTHFIHTLEDRKSPSESA